MENPGAIVEKKKKSISKIKTYIFFTKRRISLFSKKSICFSFQVDICLFPVLKFLRKINCKENSLLKLGNRLNFLIFFQQKLFYKPK